MTQGDLLLLRRPLARALIRSTGLCHDRRRVLYICRRLCRDLDLCAACLPRASVAVSSHVHRARDPTDPVFCRLCPEMNHLDVCDVCRNVSTTVSGFCLVPSYTSSTFCACRDEKPAVRGRTFKYSIDDYFI